MKEIEDDSKKWKDIPCSWIARINFVNMGILPKAIYRFNAIYQNTHNSFHIIRTCNPKIYMEPQKTQNCQGNPERKEQSWRHKPSRLQTILQSYSNQKSMVLVQNQTYGSVEQNRESRNKPTHRSENIQQRKESLFSKSCWESRKASYKAMKLEYFLIPCTKLNPKWLKEL